VIGNELTTKRKCGDEQSTESKSFPSYDNAVTFVHRKETALVSIGFAPMASETYLEQHSQSTRKEGSTIPNPFSHTTGKSLTAMTDNAIELRSGLDIGEGGENVYLLNGRLGLPIDYCIKCLLAENYKEGTDPTGWIMSEKLDGVRCLWTGTEMYSRNGNKFNFPNFFTKNWPKAQLDG
jgi:ATP-dependent DNA ligase